MHWGQPEYTDDVTEWDRRALCQRISQETNGEGLTHWPYNNQVRKGYDRDEIQLHCVRDASWQEIRVSMKGKATHEKLKILEAWWRKRLGKRESASGVDVCEIQVGNYLGALRRGGQLDEWNRVRRYR